MSRREQMYVLLEDMFESAEEGDKKGILGSNRSYEKLAAQIRHDPPTELDLEYENRRQSFVLSVRFSSDARERLLKIPEPED